MIKKACEAFLKELRSYSIHEKLFLVFVMACSFCITAEFSVTRPVSNSVFIKHFSASFIPYAWLASMPINFVIVALYNHLLPKLGCFKTAFMTIIVTATVNIVGVFFLQSHKEFSFFHAVWKDTYILLMFQQLWSVIHSTIAKHRAKYLYGMIYGIGGLGSVLGSCIPGFLAHRVGSQNLLFFTVVIYAFFALFYKLALDVRQVMENRGELEPLAMKKEASSGGFKLILQSKTLQFILFIVILMQLSTTFVEFQFNLQLQKYLTHTDYRTEYLAKLFGLIHFFNIFLQFFGAYLLIKFLGLKKSHIFIPVIFMFNTIAFICFPVFQWITMSFSTIKACDYSIFTILKEMLYLPLKTEEKFKAKAVIDVFAFRSSKALGSFAIIVMQWLNFSFLNEVISFSLLLIFAMWIFLLLKQKAHLMAESQV